MSASRGEKSNSSPGETKRSPSTQQQQQQQQQQAKRKVVDPKDQPARPRAAGVQQQTATPPSRESPQKAKSSNSGSNSTQAPGPNTANTSANNTRSNTTTPPAQQQQQQQQQQDSLEAMNEMLRHMDAYVQADQQQRQHRLKEMEKRIEQLHIMYQRALDQQEQGQQQRKGQQSAATTPPTDRTRIQQQQQQQQQQRPQGLTSTPPPAGVIIVDSSPASSSAFGQQQPQQQRRQQPQQPTDRSDPHPFSPNPSYPSGALMKDKEEEEYEQERKKFSVQQQQHQNPSNPPLLIQALSSQCNASVDRLVADCQMATAEARKLRDEKENLQLALQQSENQCTQLIKKTEQLARNIVRVIREKGVLEDKVDTLELQQKELRETLSESRTFGAQRDEARAECVMLRRSLESKNGEVDALKTELAIGRDRLQQLSSKTEQLETIEKQKAQNEKNDLLTKLSYQCHSIVSDRDRLASSLEHALKANESLKTELQTSVNYCKELDDRLAFHEKVTSEERARRLMAEGILELHNIPQSAPGREQHNWRDGGGGGGEGTFRSEGDLTSNAHLNRPYEERGGQGQGQGPFGQEEGAFSKDYRNSVSVGNRNVYGYNNNHHDNGTSSSSSLPPTAYEVVQLRALLESERIAKTEVLRRAENRIAAITNLHDGANMRCELQTTKCSKLEQELAVLKKQNVSLTLTNQRRTKNFENLFENSSRVLNSLISKRVHMMEVQSFCQKDPNLNAHCQKIHHDLGTLSKFITELREVVQEGLVVQEGSHEAQQQQQYPMINNNNGAAAVPSTPSPREEEQLLFMTGGTGSYHSTQQQPQLTTRTRDKKYSPPLGTATMHPTEYTTTTATSSNSNNGYQYGGFRNVVVPQQPKSAAVGPPLLSPSQM